MLALAVGGRLLGLGEVSASAHLTLVVVAPFVAYLLWRRHARARFSFYLFLSLEAYRGLRGADPLLVGLALIGLGYFQLASVRRVYPRVNPRTLIARVRGVRPTS